MNLELRKSGKEWDEDCGRLKVFFLSS